MSGASRQAEALPAAAPLLERLLAGWHSRVGLQAVLMGLLAGLGQPPLHLWPLTLIGIAWLVRAFDRCATNPNRQRLAFKIAFGFGLGYFLLTMHWLGAPFLQVESARALMPLGFLLIPVLALFWGAAGAAAIAAWTTDARRIAWFAAVFMAAEWLRGHAFGGLPWVLVGYVWPAGGAVSQLASFVGAYGLTGLTFCAFAAPALLLDQQTRARLRPLPVLGLLFLLGFIYTSGAQRLAQARGEGAEFKVRVVDSGLTQVEKWGAEGPWRVFERYLALTGPAGENAADVVVWPESAIPGLMLQSPALLQALGAHLEDRVLITGLVRAETPQDQPARFFNSVAVLDAVHGDLRVGQVYDKVRLVPFGEFIPLLDIVQGFGLKLKAVQQIGSGFTPGPGPVRLAIPGAAPASPLICYEAIFPHFIGVEERGDWIVNVTNDAWFSYGSGWPSVGPAQHYNQARYRAIELGLPMARAASGGVSAIIDPFGREAATTSGEGGAAEAFVAKPLSGTLFNSFGFVITPALVLVLAGMRAWPRRERKGVLNE